MAGEDIRIALASALDALQEITRMQDRALGSLHYPGFNHGLVRRAVGSFTFPVERGAGEEIQVGDLLRYHLPNG